MKKVKALVAFSNGVIAMEQYEVRELPTDMANDLIAAGICVEISGGGSGGGVLVVTDTDGTLDKTWQEIADAMFAVIKSVDEYGYNYRILSGVEVGDGDSQYCVYAFYPDRGALAQIFYGTSSASGYPVVIE